MSKSPWAQLSVAPRSGCRRCSVRPSLPVPNMGRASMKTLVNAHGGHTVALSKAVFQMTTEQQDVGRVPCATQDVDLHAVRGMLACIAVEASR